MNKKEHAVVAVVVLAAMVVGLWAVRYGLDQARASQNAIMAQAMSNLGEVAQEAGEAEQEPEGDTAGDVPAGSVTEPVPDEGTAGNGVAIGDPNAFLQGNAALSAALETGDFSSVEVLMALGLLKDDSRPSMGSTEMTPQSLSDWLQTSSMDALSAQAALQGAQAIASGVGSEDNAQLRAFAKSQGSANYEAARNRLAETAMELSMNYLQCRETLAVHEQVLAFYLELQQSMQTLYDEALTAAEESAGQEDAEAPAATETPAESSTEEATEEKPAEEKPATEDGASADENTVAEDTATEKVPTTEETPAEEAVDSSQKPEPLPYVEAVKKDLDALAQLIAETQAAMEQCQSDLDAAAQVIQMAVGNPAEVPLVFSGELTAGTLSTTSEEEAVSRALADRNELKEAAYAIIQAEEQLKALRYQYPPNSPEVLAQQSTLAAARAEYLELSDTIELEIRRQYKDLTKLAEDLSAAAPEVPEIGPAESILPEDNDEAGTGETSTGEDNVVTDSTVEGSTNENATAEGTAGEGAGEEGTSEEQPAPEDTVLEAISGVYHVWKDENGQWTSNSAQLLELWAQYIEQQIKRVEDVARMNLALLEFEHAAGVGTLSVTIA